MVHNRRASQGVFFVFSGGVEVVGFVLPVFHCLLPLQKCSLGLNLFPLGHCAQVQEVLEVLLCHGGCHCSGSRSHLR